MENSQVGEQCLFEWRSNSSEEKAGARLASICKLPVEEGKEGRRKKKQKRVRKVVGFVIFTRRRTELERHGAIFKRH
jgi:hypothetical protein